MNKDKEVYISFNADGPELSLEDSDHNKLTKTFSTKEGFAAVALSLAARAKEMLDADMFRDMAIRAGFDIY